MGSIDFNGVLVSNATAAWLSPSPAFDVWFPYQPAGLANGVLITVKNEYSGITYAPSTDVQINAPSWAIWTSITDSNLTLTVYTLGTRRSPQHEGPEPVVHSFTRT